MDVDDISLSDDQIRMLQLYRGGCHCNTMRFPPCHICTDPLTQEEAEVLGFLPRKSVCRDSLGVALTEGKEYEVTSVDGPFVAVTGDDGKRDIYFADRFQEV